MKKSIEVQMPVEIMKLTEISLSEVLNHENNAYYVNQWKKRINSYNQRIDTKFYESINEDNSKSVYVIYTIEEGIRFIQKVSLDSVLSNSGFIRVYMEENGSVYSEQWHKEGPIANNIHGRKFMAKMCNEFGFIFSNSLPLSKKETIKIEYEG